MQYSNIQTAKVAGIVSAALLLASCGGGANDDNEAVATQADSNVMFEQLGNDASALEAAGNAAPLEVVNDEASDASSAGAEATTQNSSQPVLGETSGGDTGGNTVQGNTTGL